MADGVVWWTAQVGCYCLWLVAKTSLGNGCLIARFTLAEAQVY